MKRRRMAVPILALTIGAMSVLAIGGGALAVAPNTPATPPRALAAPAAGETTNYCGTVPLDVEIILDTSGSMTSNSSGGHTRLYWAEAAATQLVNQLDGNGGVGGASGLHHVGLTTFSGSSATPHPSLWTSDANTVNLAISGLVAGGTTPFKTGMATGAGDLTAHPQAGAQHVIIFLSDGRPNPDQGPSGSVATITTNNQRPTQAELDAFLASADKIYSIAIGPPSSGSSSNDVDTGLMQLLAKGAATYYNINESGLPALFGNIFTQIACPSLVITASSDTMTYGTVPTITPSYSGFVSPDTAASLTKAPICVTTEISSSPVGTYPSTCSGAEDPHYNITYVAGTVGVTPAPLVITASSGTMTVGDTVPTIAPSYGGFVGTDTAASLTTPPTCTTTATSSSPVGTYPSSCSGAVDPNYTISYVAGTVTVTAPGTTAPPATITPAPATITPAPAQSVQAATSAPTVKPSQAVEGATSAPSATTPATSTGGAPGGGSGSPLFALLIALFFGGFGFMAVEAQRRHIRR